MLAHLRFLKKNKQFSCKKKKNNKIAEKSEIFNMFLLFIKLNKVMTLWLEFLQQAKNLN